jgi:hypothetical protein
MGSEPYMRLRTLSVKFNSGVPDAEFEPARRR